MLNGIWVILIVLALVCGAVSGKLDLVTKASIDSAEISVTLALGLVGVMAFWLGMMRVLEQGGALKLFARAMGPLMRRIFPDVPADHPAMSMMLLNISANMLGLANAATPFGLKAMTELDRLNPRKGTASNAMAMFLAINTSGITLIPTTMLALRASLKSTTPAAILVPTLLASVLGTIVAVLAARVLQPFFPVTKPIQAEVAGEFVAASSSTEPINEPLAKHTIGSRTVAWMLAAVLVAAFSYAFFEKLRVTDLGTALRTVFIDWPLLLLLGGITLFAVFRRVKIYDAIVEGGKEAFPIALKIIPFLVAILVAIGMLRASGAIDLLTQALTPVTIWFGMPPEVLPMAFLRSLSGSGAYGVAAELMKTHGADSLIGNIASTLQGSSETTFYILAVYFGSVQVRNGRHTLVACLIADIAAVLSSVWLCRLML